MIDTLDAVLRYDSATRELPNHSLKTVARHLGTAGPDREQIRGDQVYAVYRRDPERVRRYATADVNEVAGVARMLGDAAFALAQIAPRRYERLADAGAATGVIDPLLVRAYLRAGMALPAHEAGLRRRELLTRDVSSRARLTKTPAQYFAVRQSWRRLPYEAVLANGRRSWSVGDRIRVDRKRNGGCGLLDESDDGPVGLGTVDKRDYDVDHYERQLHQPFSWPKVRRSGPTWLECRADSAARGVGYGGIESATQLGENRWTDLALARLAIISVS